MQDSWVIQDFIKHTMQIWTQITFIYTYINTSELLYVTTYNLMNS